MAVTSAKEGDVVYFPEHLIDTDKSGPVAASCDDRTISGRWACSTHREMFTNNLQASIHEDGGTHLSYWWCDLHGPEAP